MNQTLYRAPDTPISMFAPFFARYPQLFAYVEDHIRYEEVIPGLIVSCLPGDDEKFFIVTNARRYSNYLFRMEQNDPLAVVYTKANLIPGSEDYEKNVDTIGLHCYSRSEIPDHVLRNIRYLRHSHEAEPTLLRKER